MSLLAMRRSARRLAPSALAAAMLLAPAPARGAAPRDVLDAARVLYPGRPAAAESLLKVEADGLEGREAAVLLVELGDLVAHDGRSGEAERHYRRAASKAPMMETPVRRLVALGVANLPGSTKSLLRDLAEARQIHPGIALWGFRDLVRCVGRSAPEVAGQALVEIVDLLAGTGGPMTIEMMGVDSVAVPGPWAELRGALDITATVPAAGFWMSADPRRNVLARAKLAQGRRAGAQGRPDLADSHWVAGLRIAPDYMTYLRGPLSHARLVRLELATELIGLYSRHPSMDSDQSRTGRLVEELFEGKGGAYHANDLEAIQRHHEVLGFVYADRGTWTSEAYAHNAIFQFQRALAVAAKRRETVGYQPLPLVRAALARGLDGTGATKEAGSIHLEAAQAFLDIDRLDSARAELERAGRSWGAPVGSGPPVWAATRQVLDSREWLSRTAAAQSPPDSTFEVLVLRWDASHLPELQKPFFERQRFKILSDLAAIDVAVERRLKLTAAMARAFEEQPTPELTGIADLVRLEQLQAGALKAVGASASPPKVQRAVDPGAKGLLLGATAGSVGARVLPSKDLSVALRLAMLQASDSTLRKAGSRLTLTRDSVVVEAEGASEEEQKTIQRRLRKIAPVRDLRVVRR